MNRYIIIRTQFEFLHRWKDAPKEVEYLRNIHRHDMLVTCKIEVKHNDRELEFFMVLHDLDKYLKDNLAVNASVDTSCEGLAEAIIEYLTNKYGERHLSVEISEDGKCSGVVEV